MRAALLLFLACVAEKPAASCEEVTSACPDIVGERALWGGCLDAYWLAPPRQCSPTGCADVPDYGVTLYPEEGYAEPWATCSTGYTTIGGTICPAC